MIILHQSQDNGILDSRVVKKYIFNIFRVNIQAVCKHDQVLLASLYIQVSFRIPITQVTRMIPAILESGSSSCCILPVAKRHVWPLNQQFAILGDAHLLTGQRLANRAINVFIIRGDGNNRRALGSTVPLHHSEAHIFPAYVQLGWQICSAADKEVKMPAKTLVHLPEEQWPQTKWEMCRDTMKHLPWLLPFHLSNLPLNPIHKEL